MFKTNQVQKRQSVVGRLQVLLGLWLMLGACSLRVLHESLLVSALTYGSETMIWKDKERSSIRAVQMNNLRGLLGIKRMDKIPNVRVRELCGVTRVGRKG